MSAQSEATIDAALARIRGGEPLRASFLHEHGLEWPFHEVSELRFDAEHGEFVLCTGTDAPRRDGAPGYDSERAPERRLDEASARRELAQSLPLRSALGLR